MLKEENDAQTYKACGVSKRKAFGAGRTGAKAQTVFH